MKEKEFLKPIAKNSEHGALKPKFEFTANRPPIKSLSQNSDAEPRAIGGLSWITGMRNQVQTQPGTRILFPTCTLVGIQPLLSFFDFDIKRRSK